MIKKIIIGFLNTVFRFSVLALVVVGVYRLAMYSYHFGYMVFADASKEPPPGRDIVITAENTEDVMELGRLLETRGLIEDRKIFLVQERLSEFHGKMVPGTYTLNTSMKAAEMIEIMAQNYVEDDTAEEEGDTSKGSSGVSQPAAGSSESAGGYYDPQTGEFIEGEQSAEPTMVNPDESDAESGDESGTTDEQSEPVGDGAVEKKTDAFSAGAGAR
ncbi:MAG: hypothetical protein IK078_09985 [Lachnospiraceae bacterium]|nr:hypothetical protein [Lachnospiraceae bacterium]